MTTGAAARYCNAQPPRIHDIRTRPAQQALSVSWQTDEFATGELRCGQAPGAYTSQRVDAEFTRARTLVLTDLAPGQAVYCIIIAVDRSGNRATSSEFRAETKLATYLPLLVRP